MKNWKIFFSVLFAVAVISCGGGDSDAEDLSDLVDETTDELMNDGLNDGDCSKSSVEDWDNFIGITYETNELDLEDIIGKFTGGEYTADSSAFIYYFKRVDRAPVTVWVNGKTGAVETIFVEILGYEEYFEGDVKDLKKEFKLEDCDTRWFGMHPDDLIKEMGKPDKDEEKSEGVRSIFYDSKDYDISVNFKFYESQGGMCSSISVNWFY